MKSFGAESIDPESAIAFGICLGLPMYKSILKNLDGFPIFISSPPNLILKIPKIRVESIEIGFEVGGDWSDR